MCRWHTCKSNSRETLFWLFSSHLMNVTKKQFLTTMLRSRSIIFLFLVNVLWQLLIKIRIMSAVLVNGSNIFFPLNFGKFQIFFFLNLTQLLSAKAWLGSYWGHHQHYHPTTTTQQPQPLTQNQVYTSPISTYDTFLKSLGQDLSNLTIKHKFQNMYN